MTRSTHLVGSWTARSPAMAMDNALERLAPHLQRHGETGYLRSKWVQPTLEALRANPEGLVVGEVDVAAACGLARRENITQVERDRLGGRADQHAQPGKRLGRDRQSTKGPQSA